MQDVSNTGVIKYLFFLGPLSGKATFTQTAGFRRKTSSV